MTEPSSHILERGYNSFGAVRRRYGLGSANALIRIGVEPGSYVFRVPNV